MLGSPWAARSLRCSCYSGLERRFSTEHLDPAGALLVEGALCVCFTSLNRNVTIMKWPHLLADWITPALALRDWRARIARVESQEAAYFARLPYVRGLAIIGSVGRGTAYPISDLDMLVAADTRDGQDPEHLIRVEETERNRRLHAALIPNDIEAANWVLLASEVSGAVGADDAAFFRLLDHPHWLGIVLKAQGARLVQDFDGNLGKFLERCSRVLFADRFVDIWLRRVIDDAARKLSRARDLVAGRGWVSASFEIISAAYGMMSGAYAMWRLLPQSLSRGVTRFLAAASEAGDPAMGELFLLAARLTETDTWQRFDAVPADGRRERDLWLAIRQGAGEDVDPLAGTRDFLLVTCWVAERDDRVPPYPVWSGATDNAAIVRAQLQAAEAMLQRLQSARGHSEKRA